MLLDGAIETWPARNVAAAVLHRTQVQWQTGDAARLFELASLTKLLTAWAVLVAVEEETVSLDEPAGPSRSTVRHLLAHASGLGPDGDVLASPGARRIYSNAGYELLAEHVAAASGLDFATYLREAVLGPLSMTHTRLVGSPAHGAVSTLDDMVGFASEMAEPKLVAPATHREATRTQFVPLAGVLPGFGRHDPNPWGLGPEIRGHKSPHWTGRKNSDRTFGHFGRAGTFVWVDPAIDAACVTLTDLAFGEWAIETWPPFSDAVVERLTS